MVKKNKQHLEGRSREERKATRATLGTLQQPTVQPKTKERYSTSLDQFYEYLHGPKPCL